MLSGSWAVEYGDGTVVQQWDATHPQAVEGEVPFRAIAWDRVDRVVLESQWARSVVDLPAPAPGHRWSLRRRTFSTPDDAVECFMLVQSEGPEEVDAANLRYALYWLPDGATHECGEFWSKAVADYAVGLVRGEVRPLPQASWMAQAEVTGHVSE